MASKSIKTLGIFRQPGLFDQGIGAALPEAYKKFYKEWKLTQPTAVHYIPEEGNWKRNEVTGEVLPVQNISIPIFHPKESNEHIWGGEGVVQGFQSRGKYRRRVPHFWVPILKRSVIYSEVLDKHISVIVTDRAIKLINEHYGFDHYLLKTPACDLQSLLPLYMKRKVLQELENGCPAYGDRPEKQKNVLDQYKKYLSAYTPEEIKWYGYSFSQACRIMKDELDAESKKSVIPLKHIYRAQLIEKLKAVSLEEATSGDPSNNIKATDAAASWLQKINPFGKKHET